MSMEQQNHYWHVAGPPWTDSRVGGATINIGSQDPHMAVGFIEIPPEQEGMDGREVELAEYICRLHNENLTGRGCIQDEHGFKATRILSEADCAHMAGIGASGFSSNLKEQYHSAKRGQHD